MAKMTEMGQYIDVTLHPVRKRFDFALVFVEMFLYDLYLSVILAVFK